MCDPITIAGAALTAGSVAANTVASQNVASARTKAMSAERERQLQLQQEAEAANKDAQGQYENFGAKQDAKASSLADYFTGSKTEMPANAPELPVSSSNLVVAEQKKQGDLAKLYTDKVGTALGNLRAFGGVMGDAGRVAQRDFGTVGQIGNFKTGSSAVLPYELEAANAQGNGLKSAADIMGGLGSIGSMYGLNQLAGAGKLGSFGLPAASAATNITPRLGALY